MGEHNIVNMGERIYGRVRSKNSSGYGLIYKLQRVTFIDASGKLDPAPRFHVVGGGSGGGSNIVKAAVQKSKYVPKKPYWRSLGKNMKFSFLSFGFENLSEQNEVDIKCRIKIDIDPNMFPEPPQPPMPKVPVRWSLNQSTTTMTPPSGVAWITTMRITRSLLV